MSRHRFYQNAEEDYSDEEEYNYGSSYGTSCPDDEKLSSSVENQYLYRRGQSGTTPKMSSFFSSQVSQSSLPEEGEFEMDLEIRQSSTSRLSVPGAEFEMELEVSPPRTTSRELARKNSGFDTSGLTPEEIIKLNSGLDYILDVVGDTVPEATIKEALVTHNFNAENALNYILSLDNRPSSSHIGAPSPPSTTKKSGRTFVKPTLNLTPAVPSTIPMVPTITTPTAPIIKTQPAATVGFEVTKLATTTGKKNLERTALAGKESKRSRSNSPLPTNLEALSLQDAVTGTSPPGTTTSTPFKQVVMRREKVNVATEFNRDRGSGQKEVLNLVVIGHVDSGKSTLMGHLLFLLGSVSQKVMHKYEKESKKIGKQSFMYAWVLDETEEERDRGITMDVGQNKFETEHRLVTLLDAPGHRDFIPNMISGAYQADVAVLVVNATTGEFEAGFEAGGQTREHALLVRSLGVSQMVVAVNKLDTVNWGQARFQEVRDKLKVFLTKQAGFREADLTFVPCSGLTGDNLVARPAADAASWYSGPTLLQAIDTFKIPERPVEKPFRLSISDVFKSLATGFSVAGRVESGAVMREDRVLCSPLNQICIVKSVLVEQADTQTGYAGDHVTLLLTGPEQVSVTAGMVLCDPAHPVPVTNKFQAKIVVFNIEVPITKGFPVVLHYGSVSEQATVKKLISQLNKSTGEVLKSKPRCLTGNCSALVEISVSRPLPLELYKDSRELGRFMLRTGGHTIAAGMVTSIS